MKVNIYARPLDEEPSEVKTFADTDALMEWLSEQTKTVTFEVASA